MNWDGTTRGYSRQNSIGTQPGPSSNRRVESASLHDALASPIGHLSVFGSPGNDAIFGSPRRHIEPPEFLFTHEHDAATPSSTHILSTKWHELSEEGVQTAISDLSKTENVISDIRTYQNALRALSSAYHNLCRTHLELEEKRREQAEREAARKARAEELLKELQPSEHDIAKRVLQSLFTDDDEEGHRVQRKHSSPVCCSFICMI